MQLPLQITFRDIPQSDAVEARIREKAAKLDQYYDRIMSCRVVIESPHAHKNHGKLYHVRLDITVPGGEVVVSRTPDQHQAHEDIYVAIRDAFDAAKRQLEDYGRKQRREVKIHEVPPHGRVSQIVPDQDFGKIQTSEGREIYFHRNSVVNGGFEKLEVGSEVRFVESQGDEGPQASTVQLIGKHHIVE
jgi:ribosomal subunit interface protein